MGEKFFPKYDIPALTLITVGCLGVLCIATVPIPDYTFVMLVELVWSVKSLIYLCLIGVFFIVSAISFYMVLKALTRFEKKLEEYAADNLGYTDTNQTTAINDVNEENEALGIINDDPNLALLETESSDDSLDVDKIIESTTTKRPTRLLLMLVSDLTIEKMKEIDAESGPLKLFSIVPMVMLMCCTGCLSGLNQAAFRFVGLAFRDGHAFYSVFVMGLILLGLVGSCLQFALLNLALKNYRQIDVVPVYESTLSVMTVVSGLVLFNESQYYSWERLIGIFVSTFLVVLGIGVLTMKDNIKAEMEKKLALRSERHQPEIEQLEHTEEGPENKEDLPLELSIREFTEAVPH
jgi:drug/metabolite transporter (DMT)-like permease